MTFDKEKLANLLKKAKGDRSINQYSLHSGVSAAHISRLMRGLLTAPPNPSTIASLADKAYNDITYNDLMQAAGHITESEGGLEHDSDFPVVAGKEITLSEEELKLFNELKKHPVLFHDLASDPEQKVKELIKLYKMKKMFLEEDEEEYGDGFGELED